MRDQMLAMDRLLNCTEVQGYIYCLKVVIQQSQLPPMLFVQLSRIWHLTFLWPRPLTF